MRTTTFLATLIALICLTGSVTAQCLVPGTENFDALPQSSTSYGIGSPATLPVGWAHDLLAPNSWRVDANGTTSSVTGPSGDHTPGGGGAGKYIYTETSGGSAGVEARLTVCFDASTLTTPTIEFWYHMYNGSTPGNMGTLEINQSLDDGVTYASNLFTMTGNQGDQWLFSGAISPDTSAANGTVNTDVYLQIKGIRGASFNSDMAIDDFKFGEPTPLDWETNSDAGSVDVNGAQGNVFTPAIVNETGFLCGAVPSLTGTFNVSSNVPGGLYEVVLTPAAIVGSSGAGSITIGGEILNLSILTVGSWSYLNGGTSLGLATMPGAGFPGSVGGSFSATWDTSAPLDISMQGVFTDPTAPGGFVLSQASELHVAFLPAATSIPGPTADDTNLIIDVTAAPTCWFPSGVSFNGTVYTDIAVAPNGRILFTSVGDSDFSPTVAEALTDAPFFGFWTDFNVNTAGTITVSNPTPGVVRADWTGVAYIGQPAALCTFGLEIDDASQIFSIDGLGGIVANPVPTGTGDAQFLGLSVGAAGGATDPGLTTFTTPGGGPAIPNATDMLYDYYDYVTGVGGLVGSLATPGLSEIQFNYISGTGFLWTGL